MTAIDTEQITPLAKLVAATRPDWHPHAVYGAVSAAARGNRKHRAPNTAELVTVVGLVLDDPNSELEDLTRFDGPYWARARRLLRTDEDGRTYANAAAMRTLRAATAARDGAVDLTTRAAYMAQVRRELMAAGQSREAVLAG